MREPNKSLYRELIRLYWEIGKDIVERQEKDGWGASVIERASKDIQNEFPGIEEFSITNIRRMKAFYLAYSIHPQAVGELETLLCNFFGPKASRYLPPIVNEAYQRLKHRS